MSETKTADIKDGNRQDGLCFPLQLQILQDFQCGALKSMFLCLIYKMLIDLCYLRPFGSYSAFHLLQTMCRSPVFPTVHCQDIMCLIKF